jgi:hypothetical protein
MKTTIKHHRITAEGEEEEEEEEISILNNAIPSNGDEYESRD